ncbi:hypothetical protein KKG48_03730 [Patescibacteria group bacterium]|nr:hypothetical protein [Patescibacteria group bacterium]
MDVLRGETGLLARVESPSPTMSDLSNVNYTRYSRLVKLSAHPRERDTHYSGARHLRNELDRAPGRCYYGV